MSLSDITLCYLELLKSAGENEASAFGQIVRTKCHDFERILTETDACLTRQYQAMLATDEVELVFSGEGIRRLAEIAWSVNEKTENIGARRLYTVMERLLEEISFDAGTRGKETVTVDAAYVDARLKSLAGSEDLARYVL